MPADTNLIFSSGHIWSYLTDMRDGATVNFTTPALTLGTCGIPPGSLMVARLFIPAYTTRSPGAGVGFSRPFITAVVQGAEGAPATEANWQDVAYLRSIHPNNCIRVHVPTGSTGEGTPANPIYSNVAIARFQGAYTNYRLSVQVIASWPDLSAVTATLRVGHALVDHELY